MKFNLKWILGESFMLFVFIIVLFLIAYFPKEAPEGLEGIKTIYYGLIFISIILSIYLIAEFLTGKIYYEYEYYNLSDFEIKKYENRVMIIHNNWAYSFVNKKDEIARLKEIKVKKFYNIRKQFITWEFAIYEQF